MVGSYNHILNAPPNGSPMDLPSPPDPLLILSRIALRGGLRWTENLKDGAPKELLSRRVWERQSLIPQLMP